MSDVYSEFTKVYGPYTRKDGRQIVVLANLEVKRTRTVSYPKYLVECALGRYLNKDETIDHIDGDIYNNSFDNLRIVPLSVHALGHTSSRIWQTAQCPICGALFQVNGDRKKTCGSKRCIGKSAHLNGYNKGNDLPDNSKLHITYQSNHNVLDAYPSVAQLLQSCT